ncbi:MAG: prepilin peptidase [Acidimicrobiia bacterium]|nr:prepilin peptidase [Acidimicrobiia bacterium]
METSLVAPVAALFGLAFGSFINVVAHRVPLEKSVTSPASACPACGAPIRQRDNVPVLSWLLLRGRCRDCGARISARYPLVEAGTAGLFAATVLVIGVGPELPAYLWFVAVGLTLALTDIDVHRLPNRILYPSTVVGATLLLIAAVVDGDLGMFARAVGGGAFYFVLFLILALVARGGFGFGDVKLAFFLGLFLAYDTWDVLGAGIALGIAIGGLWAIGLLITRNADRKAKIPFGPAMILGAYAALVVGQELVDWYLGS